MITARAFAGKTYAVLGLARSGVATVDALLASGAKVVAWDSNPETIENLRSSRAKSRGVGTDGQRPSTSLGTSEIEFADILETDLTGFAGVVVSPGVPLNRHPIVAHAARYNVPIIGDVELFAQARAELPPHKVVGITGTNGKSTTTALVHHILETAGVPTLMGGNIGLPILSRDPLPEGGVYVLELSSYQIDLTQTLDCDVAVLLNITPDHLDRYDGSFEAYATSKHRLFKMQRGDDDLDFGFAWPAAQFGKPGHGDRNAMMVKFRIDPLVARWSDERDAYASLFFQAEFPALQGPHNLENAAAALAVCRALGVPERLVERALRTYAALPHRMQAVRTLNGVLFLNDSKATNPDSTAPALAAYPDIHWIVGGRAKGEMLGPCEAHLNHVRAAYTIGESGPMFAALLREAGVETNECEFLDRAVRAAADAAKPGEVVLLSPASASFDQYRDFEARGDAFRALVEAL